MTFNRSTFTKRGTSAFVKNFSKNSGHGTVNGCTIVKGVAGQALQINGGSEHVAVPHSPGLIFTPAQSFTFCAWIRPAKIGPRWQSVVVKSRESTGWFGIWINPVGKWTFPTTTTIGSGYLYGPQITPGAWHHVAIVQDAKAKGQAIVVNGVLGAKHNYCSNCTGTGPLWIGNWKSSGGTFVEPFTGHVDELAIFNRALTLKEIQSLMNMGRRGQSLAR
jgi:hypothetical protein